MFSFISGGTAKKQSAGSTVFKTRLSVKTIIPSLFAFRLGSLGFLPFLILEIDSSKYAFHFHEISCLDHLGAATTD